MPHTAKLELLGLDLQELTDLARQQGEPDYRGQQLFEALYRQRLESLAAVTTLPGPFRTLLTGHDISVGVPEIEN
ncbi:MAG: 23S rRNA (adenine(2503)-C(2))-methyltransferase RlmN, partial [Acidobacteria bacterium]|nr:23S rRNA (adenine(2503)-C(2))-methyltransferase RlmN [Acidobacteriota bacterium]